MQEISNPFKPRLFTPSEVAKLLSVESGTVYAWISRREMRSLKVGHRRFISPVNIKEFQERRNNGDYIDYTYANGMPKNGGFHG